MKAFVSYVLKDSKGHKHLSEILNIEQLPYSFSNAPPVSEVLECAEIKSIALAKGQQLTLAPIFNV